MTLQQLWNSGRERLETAGVSDAALDARYLLMEAFGLDQVHFLMERTVPLPDTEQTAEKVGRYRKMTERRAARVPLQHITGNQSFMGLDFLVNDHVLIPRQDTESLTEMVLREQTEKKLTVLDMCTGSGCIAISLAVLGGYESVTGVDISPEALEVAKQNRDRLWKSQDGRSLEFLKSDLFENLPADRRYDVIVSNPPYIPTEVIRGLEPEVRDHEPALALDGDSDGLKFYRRLASDSGLFLKSGGTIYLEIGWDQGESVSRLFEEAGYEQIGVFQDDAGKDRIVRAVRKEI